MLSRALLNVLVADGEIEVWMAPGVTHQVRNFMAVEPVRRALSSRWKAGSAFKDDNDAEAARGDILAVLTNWQKGAPIRARTQLKPLRPPPSGAEAIWELRAPETPPGVRILGFIPLPNTFVATGVYPRKALGAAGSQGWMTAIGHAIGLGGGWFGSNRPISWPISKKFGPNTLPGICDEFV